MTDFNSFFVQVARIAKERNLVLSPITIVIVSDGVPDIPVRGAPPGSMALYQRIDLTPLEYLSKNTTLRLMYASPKVGDNWRKRYHALTLHNQVHVNHLPYIPFPPSWPTYIPKDKLANWFEAYAEAMELDFWTGSEFIGATYDGDSWTATLRQGGGLSGFTKRSESEYDPFGAAHSSTSISAALGFAVANKLSGTPGKAIAVIGDGAMSAGMAYEAMNNAGASKAKLLVILNDNDMSIAPPVGAMSAYLSRVVSSRPFINLRDLMARLARRFPAPIERAAKRADELATEEGRLARELSGHHAEMHKVVKSPSAAQRDGHATARLADIQERMTSAERRLTQVRDEAGHLQLSFGQLAKAGSSGGARATATTWTFTSILGRRR